MNKCIRYDDGWWRWGGERGFLSVPVRTPWPRTLNPRILVAALDVDGTTDCRRIYREISSAIKPFVFRNDEFRVYSAEPRATFSAIFIVVRSAARRFGYDTQLIRFNL